MAFKLCSVHKIQPLGGPGLSIRSSRSPPCCFPLPRSPGRGLNLACLLGFLWADFSRALNALRIMLRQSFCTEPGCTHFPHCSESPRSLLLSEDSCTNSPTGVCGPHPWEMYVRLGKSKSQIKGIFNSTCRACMRPREGWIRANSDNKCFSSAYFQVSHHLHSHVIRAS